MLSGVKMIALKGLGLLTAVMRMEMLTTRRELRETNRRMPEPKIEAIQKPRAQPELETVIDKYLMKRIGTTMRQVRTEWNADFTKARLFDWEGDMMAIIIFKDGKIETVSEFPTPALVRAKNVRLGNSCAIGMEDTYSDGSPTGRLSHARAAFAGQMSTN